MVENVVELPSLHLRLRFSQSHSQPSKRLRVMKAQRDAEETYLHVPAWKKALLCPKMQSDY